MKRIFTSLLLIAFSFTLIHSQAVVEIEIGDGTTTTNNFPCNGSYDYSWANFIITADQFGTTFIINEILFDVANNPSNYTMENQQIYLGYTTNDEVNRNFPNVYNNNFTLVYNGSITWDGSGWQGIALEDEYYIGNSNNLQIVWVNGHGASNPGYPEFRKTDTDFNSAAYNYSNNSTPDAFGNYANSIPNLKLTKIVPGLIAFSPDNNGLVDSLTPTLSLEVDDRFTNVTIYFDDSPSPWPNLIPGAPIENNTFSYTFTDPLDSYTNYYWDVILFTDRMEYEVVFLSFKTDHQMEGEGTEENPYLVDSIVDLKDISTNKIFNDKYFLQVANIDASNTANFNEGKGFLPIGFDQNYPFTGSYDGQNYTISNLYINRPELSFMALFGNIDNAEISNLGLVDVEVTGNSFVAGLVSYAHESVITNSYTTGLVNAGVRNAGGLVGFCEESSINRSYSRVAVSSSHYHTGGLIGYVYDGTIANCYATGPVIGGSGLVGQSHNSDISYCYANGAVTGNSSDIGGLIGNQTGTDNNIISSFWDMETSGQTSSFGGVGKTSQEMTNLDTYLEANWDFVDESENGIDDIWTIDPDINSAYPFIQGLGYIAPEILTYIPETTDLDISPNSLINFSVTADEVLRNLTYSWYVDDVEQDNNSNQFSYEFNIISSHEVRVVVANEDYRTDQLWSINVVVSNDADLVASVITGIDSNYPNPFNPETTIEYSLNKDSLVRIAVYDLKGRLVRTLKKEYEQAGAHSVIWNGINNDGKNVSSGSYFIKMESNDNQDLRKITLIK